MDTSQALRSKPAMVISAVCSRWRRNALSMPVMWSRISFQWKMDAGRDYRKDEHTGVFFSLANFLNRSQKCLKTVNLVVFGSPFLKPGVLHPLASVGHRASAWQVRVLEEYTLQYIAAEGKYVSCPVLPLYSRFIPSFPLSRLIPLVPLPTSSRWRNHNRHNYLLLTLPQVVLTTFPSLHLLCSIPRYALVLFPFPLVPCSTFPFTLTDRLRTFHDPVYPPYS
ncbi:hypothetical protein BDP27DRAFT_1312915 [Rhodocollybia butyracea]|uniref:F-box domain-containing protein n=1 Tax=Rhodocollybia butyracea TaxID=206335 RepID=A0A9P5UG27_9AGAR|nr:hypothetical protein BDP27DRAFT_1312915 [Rhodocollybia butyracea]